MTGTIAEQPRPPRYWAAAVRILVAVALGGLLVLLGGQAASAHADLISTTPEDAAELEEAPAAGLLEFNEPVRLLDGSIRLFLGDEPPRTLAAKVRGATVVAPLPEGLSDGAYALSYRVVSADGHPISGAITFTVGEAASGQATPAPEASSPRSTSIGVSVLTATEYVSLLTFAGLLIFERTVLRGSRHRLPARTRAALRSSGLGAILSSALLVPVSALNLAGEKLGAILTPSAWAPSMLWAPSVVAALILAGVTTAFYFSTRSLSQGPARAAGAWASCIALGAPVLIGHSQLMHPRALIVAADLGHLLAGAFWVGGVLGLILVLTEQPIARGDGTAEAGVSRAATVVHRFSGYAIWSVALLAASGIVMGVMIVGSVTALVTTPYGWTLLIKIGVVASVVAIAGYNRLRLLPALRAEPGAQSRRRRLRRALAWEAGLLAVVLVVTGVLTNLSPNDGRAASAGVDSAAPSSVEISGGTTELMVAGTLQPARAGENSVEFFLESDGSAVTPAEVTVRARLPDQELGPFDAPGVLDPATGRYAAELSLPVPGDWSLQVVARISTFSEPIVTIPVSIR